MFCLEVSVDLEKKLNEAFVEMKVNESDKNTLLAFLAPLKHKSNITKFHHNHSVRVALLARKIAHFMHLDEKALFFAGLMHDLGKCQTALETLGNTEEWTEKDIKEIKDHVTDGYRLLKGRFDFTASIILWHHRFQKNGYPKKLPPKLHHYSTGTNVLIVEYGRILAIADVFDALHRINSKFGEKKILAGPEIKEKMLEFNSDRKQLVTDLYNAGIFTMHDEVIENDFQKQVYETIWDNLLPVRCTRETGRHVMLAAALEPLADKHGCTTRYTNASRHLKLEYFISAAINIGEAFEELGERIIGNAYIQPPKIYDVAFRAQRESFRNRAGGRINQGIIELLVPLVASQHLFNRDFDRSVEDVLQGATLVLKGTNKEDVYFLMQTKKLAYDLSGYFDRTVAEHNVDNVFGYYKKELEVSGSATSVAHNSEFVNGFSTVFGMYKVVIESKQDRFSDKTEEAFEFFVQKYPDVGRGFGADCIAAALYLCFSQNPKIKLVI